MGVGYPKPIERLDRKSRPGGLLFIASRHEAPKELHAPAEWGRFCIEVVISWFVAPCHIPTENKTMGDGGSLPVTESQEPRRPECSIEDEIRLDRVFVMAPQQERLLPKQNVVGSNPIARSLCST